MLELLNVTIELSNVSKKIKTKEPLNVTKVWSVVILILPNVTLKKFCCSIVCI